MARKCGLAVVPGLWDCAGQGHLPSHTNASRRKRVRPKAGAQAFSLIPPSFLQDPSPKMCHPTRPGAGPDGPSPAAPRGVPVLARWLPHLGAIGAHRSIAAPALWGSPPPPLQAQEVVPFFNDHDLLQGRQYTTRWAGVGWVIFHGPMVKQEASAPSAAPRRHGPQKRPTLTGISKPGAQRELGLF